MYFGIPVVAYAAAAVPETLGEAGVLICKKSYFAIAEFLNLLMESPEIRQRIAKRQHQHFRKFTTSQVRQKWHEYLEFVRSQ
ncbi:MAG: hypothetical protein B5M51_01725 [Anaerolinea sp. 4484_236]|nr:MAG: hypothetical protein B5M51_01725 [Anaerolinea sp. 4484_236]